MPAVGQLDRVAAALAGEQRLDGHREHALAAIDGEADVHRRLVEPGPRPSRPSRSIVTSIVGSASCWSLPDGLVATLPTSVIRPRAVRPLGRLDRDRVADAGDRLPARVEVDGHAALRSRTARRAARPGRAAGRPAPWPARRASRPGGRRSRRAPACRPRRARAPSGSARPPRWSPSPSGRRRPCRGRGRGRARAGCARAGARPRRRPCPARSRARPAARRRAGTPRERRRRRRASARA